MSYFIFDNKKIYYEEKGEGTPLLILHGNTGSSNMFAGFVDRYSSGLLERTYVVLKKQGV